VLTVLITTHDGERTLPRVLEAYAALDPPDGGWRVDVVDNASTDGTPAILDAYASRLPLTRHFVPDRGQNRARNALLGSVAGDLVVFSDDDAIPRRDWLVQLRRAADANPGFAVFGGTILPRWERPPEEWILRRVPLGASFALTDPEWEEGPIRPSWIFGPNMAMRAEVFRAGHRFDERFGPRTGSYAMGGETELITRLDRAGLRAWHVRNAVVEHVIRSYQLTPEWLLSRAVRFGRGQYRLLVQTRRLPRPVLGLAAAPIRGIFAHLGRLGIAKCRRDPDEIFRWRWNLQCSIGSAMEAATIGRERSVPRPASP
jgi:L-malate glycosyltransferase